MRLPMRILGLLLAVCGFVLSGPIFAEAQTRAGRGAAVETGGAHLDNACRVRVNDLRVSIQNLTNDINEIRNCSTRGGVPMRSAGVIICRDIVLGHHELPSSGTEVHFFNDKGSSGWGNKGYMVGKQGDPGRDVRCDQCTGSWVDPAPACPANFTGTYKAAQVCDGGLCCGTGTEVDICCNSGTPCSECDDWTIEYAQCATTGQNIVSGGSCPSGRCCGAAPVAEICPDECSEGYWTYSINWSNKCESGIEQGQCQRCDGQNADCGQCGGQCTRTCTDQCTSHTWHASGDWTGCGGGGVYACGSGTQTRAGECRCDQTGEVVDKTMCARESYERGCSGWTYAYGNYGACDGDGKKTRPCTRCDGQVQTDCGLCGGQCSTAEGCGPPTSCDGPLVPLTADDPDIKINFIGLCFYPHRADWQTYYGFTFPHSGNAPSCTSYSGGPIPSELAEGTGWDTNPQTSCPSCTNMNKFVITALGETRTFYSLSPLGAGQISYTVNGRTVVMDKVLAYYSGPGMPGRTGAQIRISNIRKRSCQ